MAIQLGNAYGTFILVARGVRAGVPPARESLGGLRGAMQSASESLGNIGRSLTVGVTVPLVGAAGTIAKVAGDFESQMNVLAMAARSSGTSLDELQQAAMKAGADTELVGISASESAEAMTNFYKAGMDTTQIFGDLQGYLAGTASVGGAFRASVDLAAASELDLAQASDLVIMAMNTFGLSAAEAGTIADSFVQSADASNASVGELYEAMVNVGPTAAQMGMGMEDVNTALAILSGSGIKGAEAGTALKSMMLNLTRPTDDVKETLDMLNVSLYDSEGKMKSLPDIIGQLSGGMSGLTEEQRQLASVTLAGSYGINALSTLMKGGTEAWSAMSGQIGEAATAQESAAARTQGLSAAMEQLQGSGETLLLTVGLPLIQNFLTPLVQTITDVVGRITEYLNPEMINMGIVFAGVAAAAGPVLLGLGALLSPVGLVAAAIGGLAAAWSTNFMGIRDTGMAAWESIQPMLTGIATVINGLTANFGEGMAPLDAFIEAIWDIAPQWLLDALVNLRDEVLPGVSGAIQSVGEYLAPTFERIKDGFGLLVENLQPVLGALQGLFGTIGEKSPQLQQLAELVGILLVGAVQLLGEALALVLPVAGALFGGFFTTVTEMLGGLVTFVAGAVDMFTGLFTGDLDKARTGAQGVIEGLVQVIKAPLEEMNVFLQGNFGETWGAIGEAIKMAYDNFVVWTGDLGETLRELFAGLWEDVKEGVEGAMEDMVEAVEGVIGDIAEAFNNVGKVIEAAKGLGKEIIDNVIEGVKDNIERFADTLKDIVRGIIRNLLGKSGEGTTTNGTSTTNGVTATGMMTAGMVTAQMSGDGQPGGAAVKTVYMSGDTFYVTNTGAAAVAAFEEFLVSRRDTRLNAFMGG